MDHGYHFDGLGYHVSLCQMIRFFLLSLAFIFVVVVVTAHIWPV